MVRSRHFIATLPEDALKKQLNESSMSQKDFCKNEYVRKVYQIICLKSLNKQPGFWYKAIYRITGFFILS